MILHRKRFHKKEIEQKDGTEMQEYVENYDFPTDGIHLVNLVVLMMTMTLST